MNAEQMAHEIAHVIGGDVATSEDGQSVLTTGHIDGPIRSAAWDYAAGKGL